MSAKGTPATVAATKAGIPFTLHAYDASAGGADGWGRDAVASLGLDPERTFRTLIIEVDGPNGKLACAVVPVAHRLDLRAAAAALGGKRAELADPEAAQRATGYVLGGISPLGQRKRLPTVVHDGVFAHGTVFVSAGRRGLEIELAPGDLVRATGAVVAPVASAA